MVNSALIPSSINGSAYLHEQRLEVATIFITTGSMAAVCRQTGIAESTLSGWRHSSWFIEMVEGLRREKSIEFDSVLSRIIGKAMAGIEERIDHGDAVLSEGQLVRVPVKAKDLAVIAGVCMDKRQILREEIRADSVETENGTNRLEILRDRLRVLHAGIVGAGNPTDCA